MTGLPDSYLHYSQRGPGQDQDLYPWRAMPTAAPLRFKGGQSLGIAIIIPLEAFMLTPSGQPFKHPGAMVTPYPDLRHYTTRDYGNRVGVFRLLKALDSAGLSATFAINAALLDRLTPLIDAVRRAGHEIAAHGWDTDSIHWGGIDPEVEDDYIARTRAAFDHHGLAPRTWLSPARQQGFDTLSKLKAHGFDICLDWEMDRVPVTAETGNGPVQCFPLLNELDDRNLLVTRHQSEEDWHRQIIDAAQFMCDEAGDRGAGVFGFTLTPYIAGLPYRQWAVRHILSDLSAMDGVKLDTVTGLIDALEAQETVE